MSIQPSLKEIMNYKKRLNWGELPPFFHMIANSLSDVGGMNVHGFDNAFKRIVKRSNWNLQRLGGRETYSGEIIVERKPELTVHRRFVGNNYEIHCMPEVDDEPVVLYRKKDDIDFKVWDPSTMQCLVKLNDFSEFIRYAFTKGDEADMLLVKHASALTEQVLLDLSEDIQITGLKGYSIKKLMQRIEEEGIQD